jgi:predicted RNA-binding Zn ribbon-like protein
VRRAQDGPDGVLARIAEEAVDLFAGPLRADLRVCRGPGCVLYFLRDHPRREWCSAGCGNRARVARHYHRHRSAEPH